MTDKEMKISIVIPVKNGASTIRQCLERIFHQQTDFSFEVIIIDSGSTDGTADILKEFNVRVHHIEPEEFNHGETRNLGVRLSSAPIIVFTVQDAIPQHDYWLKTLIRHFEYPEVEAICGQQIVMKDLKRNPLQWFKPAGNPEIFLHTVPNFDDLPAKKQLEYCRWDNVNSAYRRSALLEVPFRSVAFGEDMIWAKDALRKRMTLVYDYHARVVHYHHQDFHFYFRRQYIIQHLVYSTFGITPENKNLFLEITRNTARLSVMPIKIRDKIKWTVYNLKLTLARFLARITFKTLHFLHGKRGPDKGLRTFCSIIPQGMQNQ